MLSRYEWFPKHSNGHVLCFQKFKIGIVMFRKFAHALFAALFIASVVLLFPIYSSAHNGPHDKKPTDHRTDRKGLAKQVDAHYQTDFGFPGFKELNRKLQADYESFTNDENMALASRSNLFQGNFSSHLNGLWSPVFDLPLVPIHVMLLTNGKVLMWDSVGNEPTENYPDHDFTRAAIWDPVSNIVTRVDNRPPSDPNPGTGYNLFCAGFAHLPDGTPFLAGGNLDRYLNGTDTLHLFDQNTNEWSLLPERMSGRRWYPSVTPLASGEMLITSGNNSSIEVFSTAQTLRRLSAITLETPYYPWIQAATNGRAIFMGPDSNIAYIDERGEGSWSSSWNRDNLFRDYGSYAMYDIGKIVASGGAYSSSSTAHINITNPNVDPVISQPANMNFRRRQHNLSVLPDGSVLATGGNSSGGYLIDMNNNVYMAEMWNPQTMTWRTLSPASRIRQYHSVSLLLPDGRIMTGGGGICGDCDYYGYLETNMEIYTPPYLFAQDGSGNLAARPTITSAPASVTYDQSFEVETPDAANISQAVFMRVSSATHSIDFEQRRVPLTFSLNNNGTGSSLSVKAPANSNIAPPGYYMLFLLDQSGVPSVAEMVRVEYGADLGAPMIVSAFGGGSAATISWIPVYGATSYTIKYGVSPGNYIQTATVGNITTTTLSGLPATRYYFVVTASNATQTGTDSNEVLVTNVGPTSAAVSVSGRVTDATGRGIPRATLYLQGQDTGAPRVAVTNPFGYYSFANLEAGRDYVLSVEAKRHNFPVSTRFITVDDALTNIDFVSDTH